MRSGREKRGQRQKRAIACAILLITILYATWYSASHVNAPSNFDDDTQYMQTAYSFAQGHFVQGYGNILGLRLMMAAPIAISYSLLGYTQLASALWDIASFIGSIVVVFLMGRELFDEYVGAAAALLLAFVPQVAVLATTVDDIVPLVFLSSFAMLCLIIGRKRGNAAMYFLSGLLLVAALLASPLGAIMALPIAVLLALDYWRRKKDSARNAAALFVGTGMGLVLLFAFNFYSGGDPLLTLISYLSFYSTENIGALIVLNPEFYLNVISLLPGSGFASSYGPAGLYFYALGLGVLYLAWRKDRRALLPALWFAFVLIYLVWGPMHISLNPFAYYTIPEVWRYIDFAIVPLVIVLAASIVRFLEDALSFYRKGRLPRFVAALPFLAVGVAVSFLLASSYQSSSSTYASSVNGLANDRAVAADLASLPANSTIYMPSFMPYALAFTQIFSGTRVGFNGVQLEHQAPACKDVDAAAYVVVPLRWLNSASTITGIAPYCAGWILELNVAGYAAVYYSGAR